MLIWCVAIATARHVAAPDQPLYRELPRRLSAWSRTPAIRRAATTVVGTRPAVLLVGYLAVFMFGFANGRAPLRHFDNEFLNLPVRWDAGWYLDIVTNGYRYAAGDETVQQNIVFFPAYPMLTRVVGRLMGGDMIGYVAAGMTVSIASFFGALVYLYLFVRERFDEETSEYALWLIAAYPFAIFFGALYTESLFLLGTLGAFYHLTKRTVRPRGAVGRGRRPDPAQRRVDGRAARLARVVLEAGDAAGSRRRWPPQRRPPPALSSTRCSSGN